MFFEFKRFLFQSRVLASVDVEAEATLKQLKNFQYQMPHLTEQWDKTFREMEHPDLHSSPIYYLTSAVGRLSLTPKELAKVYLTDPSLRKQMSVMTLDPSELERIRVDINENPNKYENMLKVNQKDERDTTWVTGANRGLTEEKMEQHEYYYRILNDGYSPLDNWPMAKEYQAYKNWVEGIETRALETLRACVYDALIYARKGQQDAAYGGSLSGL